MAAIRACCWLLILFACALVVESKKYCIVGAGVAGLAAANTILKTDTSSTVEIWEADNRIGGRLLNTAWLQNTIIDYPQLFMWKDFTTSTPVPTFPRGLDIGGQWDHGYNCNPLSLWLLEQARHYTYTPGPAATMPHLGSDAPVFDTTDPNKYFLYVGGNAAYAGDKISVYSEYLNNWVPDSVWQTSVSAFEKMFEKSHDMAAASTDEEKSFQYWMTRQNAYMSANDRTRALFDTHMALTFNTEQTEGGDVMSPLHIDQNIVHHDGGDAELGDAKGLASIAYYLFNNAQDFNVATPGRFTIHLGVPIDHAGRNKRAASGSNSALLEEDTREGDDSDTYFLGSSAAAKVFKTVSAFVDPDTLDTLTTARTEDATDIDNTDVTADMASLANDGGTNQPLDGGTDNQPDADLGLVSANVAAAAQDEDTSDMDPTVIAASLNLDSPQNVNNQADDCAKVLITVPLGVLKKNKIAFTPALTGAKKQAFQKLGYGNLAKLFLIWKTVPTGWPTDLDHYSFGYVAKGGQVYFPAIINAAPAFNQAVLVLLSGGDQADTLEEEGMTVLRRRGFEIARTILSKAGVTNLGLPDIVYISKWRTNPRSYGAYTFVPPGAWTSTFNPFVEYRKPHDNNIYFAGEGVHEWRYGFVDGAYMSGVEAGLEMTGSAVGVCDEKHPPSTPYDGCVCVKPNPFDSVWQNCYPKQYTDATKQFDARNEVCGKYPDGNPKRKQFAEHTEGAAIASNPSATGGAVQASNAPTGGTGGNANAQASNAQTGGTGGNANAQASNAPTGPASGSAQVFRQHKHKHSHHHKKTHHRHRGSFNP